ncbi:DUF192 domain-containing protein [Pectinatus brassicae]|nr:DUF192 domain-containing protein [Pectinatus brassicae]
MKLIKAVCNNKKKYLYLQLEVADTFFKRFKGLMGRSRLPLGQGMLLQPCNSIHMMFMRQSLDLVYIDKGNMIIKKVPNIRPWIGVSMCKKADAVIEMPVGSIEYYGYEVGNILTFIK